MQSTNPSAKQYLLASDFDQTLSFNDSGLVLSELVGIPAQTFEGQGRDPGHTEPGATRRRIELSPAP